MSNHYSVERSKNASKSPRIILFLFLHTILFIHLPKFCRFNQRNWCDHCARSFCSAFSLKRHATLHDEQRKKVRCLCGEYFSNEYNFKVHCKRKHGGKSQSHRCLLVDNVERPAIAIIVSIKVNNWLSRFLADFA